MINRAGILAAAAVAGIVLGSAGEVMAGGIHILYPRDAPEKLARVNEGYALGVLKRYHDHPRWFEHAHPFYTKMFNDPEMMDRLVERWEAHEQRFEYWHYCLWKVLDGYAIHHLHLLPSTPIVPPSSSNAVSEVWGNVPSGSPGNGGPGNSGPGNGNGTLGVQSVPEPSTGVLMVSGLVVGLIGLAWRRISRRSTTGERVPG